MWWKWSMFERDQTEKGYFIIQIKAKGRYLLIKISIQNRQTHFHEYIHCCLPTQRSTALTVPSVRLRTRNVPFQYHWIVKQVLITPMQVTPLGHHSTPRQAGRSTLPPSHCTTPNGLVPNSQPATAWAGVRMRLGRPLGLDSAAGLRHTCSWQPKRLEDHLR